MTTRIKWSRHRSFLYGCDRSPEMRVLKLRFKIPNFKTRRLIYKIDLEIQVRECNYAWGRISTLTTPVRKRYQTDMCYLLNEWACKNLLFPIIIKSEMSDFNKRISGLFSRRSLFIKVNLKWPLSRGSPFKIHFYFEWQENRGSSPSFHAFPLSKDCKLINPNYETYSKVTCMAIPSRDKYHSNLLYMFR